jgi:hypothetical protein
MICSRVLLPAPLGPDHAEALAWVEEQVDATEEPRSVGAEPVADPVQLHHLVAQARGLDVQRQLASPGGRLGAALNDGGGRADVGLGLRGSSRRAPAEPGELLASQVLPHGLGGLGLAVSLVATFEVGRVAPLVHEALPAVELEDPGGEPVEHVAIVGDEHQPAPMPGEPLLEPRDGVEVEVVGGLIEDEQHGVIVGPAAWSDLDQRPGEGHPLGLAAAQPVGRHVGELRDPETTQDGVGLPLAVGVSTGRHGLVHGADGEVVRLVEHDDPGIAAAPHRALLRLSRARKHPQERGLAGAVDAHQPQAIAGGEGEREAGEQLAAGSGCGEALGLEEDHRSTMSMGRPSSANCCSGRW